jgi:2-methylisocitrate lyase-like PEP mutase family enzyme
MLTGCALLLGGTALLAADLVARFGFAVTAAGGAGVGAAIGLCTLLVLLVLPAGAGLGQVFARLRS